MADFGLSRLQVEPNDSGSGSGDGRLTSERKETSPLHSFTSPLGQRSSSRANSSWQAYEGGGRDESPSLPPSMESPVPDMTGETGSCRYMAPEVWAHEHYTHKVDVFSFGVLCYELLAKKRAYADVLMTATQISRAVHAGSLRPAVPAHWPAVVQTLLSSCWAGEPADRPEFEQIVTTFEQLADIASSSPPGQPNELLDGLMPLRSAPVRLLSRLVGRRPSKERPAILVTSLSCSHASNSQASPSQIKSSQPGPDDLPHKPPAGISPRSGLAKSVSLSALNVLRRTRTVSPRPARTLTHRHRHRHRHHPSPSPTTHTLSLPSSSPSLMTSH